MSTQMKLIQRVEHFTVFESMPSTSCYNYDSVFSHKKSHMIVFQYPCYCISLVKLPKCESYSSTISTSISKRFQLRTTPTSWTTGVNHSVTKLTNLGLYIISIVKRCNTYKIFQYYWSKILPIHPYFSYLYVRHTKRGCNALNLMLTIFDSSRDVYKRNLVTALLLEGY